MRYPRLILLSFTACAAAILLNGCGGTFTSNANSSNPSSPSGPAPVVEALGEQVNGVAPNRWQYVQFNEPMDASTINSQTFMVADSSGRPVPGNVIYNANFEIAGFQPNPVLADNATYTLTVTTGVASARGVHMAAAYTSQFTTRASTDTSPIHVKNVTPFPDASCVSDTTPITITFSEGADINTINSSDILITGPGGAPIEANIGYNAATATVTLTPTAPLPSGSISVYVNNVADAAGVAMTSPFQWSFLTTCGGGSGGTTAQYMATIWSFGKTSMIHGAVTVDTAGNTTVKLSNATPNTAYTVQFCSAAIEGGTVLPDCFNVLTISTDAGGNATATAKFPKSGDWAGDFYVNDSAGNADYQTFLTVDSTTQTFLATLLPDTMTNGGAVDRYPSGSQQPLQTGTVSSSNGEVQVTIKGASPNTAYYLNDSETIYVDSSGTYELQEFTTSASGDVYANAPISSGSGGDIFQVGTVNGSSNGYIAGFSVP